MKILRSSQEIEATTATPTPEALKGYSLEKELHKAVKVACKPLAAKLTHYRNECRRLADLRDKWTRDVYDAKINAITRSAYEGDEAALAAIESGRVPNKSTYAQMEGKIAAELAEFQRLNAALFGEALLLVERPMADAVAKAQTILDSILAGLGVSRFELTGWTNHNSYVWQQLAAASRNENADLALFWEAFES